MVLALAGDSTTTSFMGILHAYAYRVGTPWERRQVAPSSQRRLGSRGVKGAAVFTPWGPSLRWGDALAVNIAPSAGNRAEGCTCRFRSGRRSGSPPLPSAPPGGRRSGCRARAAPGGRGG